MANDIIRRKHRAGFQELNDYWKRLDDLEQAMEEFSEDALAFMEEPVERVLEKIRAFEPSISVIGQIKAGKSTLLNALVGQTGLLPSDVNPWTSVITALHLNSRHRPYDTRALFRFFDQHEWDRLVATGGRLGEMASRAGFESEAEEVRSQVVEMRQTTEARLGDKFDALLGTSHGFPDLDADTINRYICYGDPSELGEGASEGVYADLTKSADLYLDVEGLPKGLCLRDTPGVNDTFMMREQITLNAISDSRVCVVVLSAHQALSTMDVALLRIICAIEAREVLIFVNRIDELKDPKGEAGKIRDSIRKTLAKLGIDDEIEILFGSGYWANFALSDTGAMSEHSRAALQAANPGADLSNPNACREAALEASGILQLHQAIAKRVISGPGAAFLKDVTSEIETIIEMSEMVDDVVETRVAGSAPQMSSTELMLGIADVLQTAITAFDDSADKLRAQFRDRLERAQQTFANSAIEALQSHVGTFGETGSWDHDPMGLRMAMKTAFTSTSSKLRREGEAAFELVLDGIEKLLQNDLGVFRGGESIQFPEQPQHKAPTVLARTISLDLGGNWWSKMWSTSGAGRFLRMGQAKKVEKKYRDLIIAETTPLIDDLIEQFFDPGVAATRDIVTTFALDQGRFCEALLESMSRRDRETPDEDMTSAKLRRISA